MVVVVLASAIGAGWSSGAADASGRVEANHVELRRAEMTSTTTVKPAKKNAKPTAKLTRTATVGGAPVAVVFAGTGSKDRDGTIASYVWDFGDGTPTATGPTVSHTYATPGNYITTLTVTDNGAATATAQAKVSIPRAILIDTVTMAQTTVKGVTRATATVAIVDSAGAPVKGVKVAGAWSGKRKIPASGTTGEDGTVVLPGPPAGPGAYTVTISKITKAGAVNAAGSNKSTGGSFTVV